MKKLLVLTMFAALAATSYGQGLVQFQNRDTASSPTVDAKIFLDGTNGAALSGTQPLYRVALLGGSTSGQAAFISGSRFAGDVGASRAGNLSILSSPSSGATWTTFRTGAAAGYVGVGTDAGRDGGAYGSTIQVQVVAWFGNFADWNSAYAAWAAGDPTVKIGASNAINVTLPTGPLDTNPTRLVGLQSFAIVPTVPEPTSLALAGIGAAALMIFRRRK